MRFSLPAAMAALRAASRASGRWLRRSLITSREAPTMARWCLTVRRERFFATSCCCYRLVSLVKVWLGLGRLGEGADPSGREQEQTYL